MHQAYLSLGSNIQPDANLPTAIDLLSERGKILKVSSLWESEAVGSNGPNFLNACVLFSTSHLYAELRDQVIHSIESRLGRKRSEDKYAPRTMDIDVIIFDDRSCNDKFWSLAYVVVPLAEIYPEFQNPLTGEAISASAGRLREKTWLKRRSDFAQLK